MMYRNVHMRVCELLIEEIKLHLPICVLPICVLAGPLNFPEFVIRS